MRISPRRAEPPAAIKVSVLLSGAHSTIRRWTDNIYLRRAAEGCGGLWRATEGCGGLRREEKSKEEEEEDRGGPAKKTKEQ